jgi:hypothetical protein
VLRVEAVVVWILGVVKSVAVEETGSRVARNHVEMDVAVPVLEEDVVEVIGGERGREVINRPLDLAVKLAPFQR